MKIGIMSVALVIGAYIWWTRMGGKENVLGPAAANGSVQQQQSIQTNTNDINAKVEQINNNGMVRTYINGEEVVPKSMYVRALKKKRSYFSSVKPSI